MYHTSAQIAAMADAHFLIEKAVENKSTVSRIRRLADNDSVLSLPECSAVQNHGYRDGERTRDEGTCHGEKNLTLSVYGAVDYQYITGGQPYVSVWDDYLPISLDHYYNLIVFF